MRSDPQPSEPFSLVEARASASGRYRVASSKNPPRPLHEIHRMRAPRAARDRKPLGGWWKRGFDIVVSLLLLGSLSPFLLLVWCLVRVTSRGPGFFLQPRGGMLGKPFQIYKFWTMSVCEVSDVKQAEKSDARVTRLGRFLRATSIDELPQLLNVLRGDMSLVGPRPRALVRSWSSRKLISGIRGAGVRDRASLDKLKYRDRADLRKPAIR